MNKRHEKHFSVLEKIAEAIEPVGRARVAALLVHQNDVIAVGYNERKSHPFQKRFAHHEDAIYCHAETAAIKNALKNNSLSVLRNSTMYVLRVKCHGGTSENFVRAMAKPCEGCSRAIAQFGIKKVYFTTDEGIDSL